ncbi:MAG: asparagine synthase C-terminal domain-containing protein [Proteobacteria bacterium]|nr:asparagine synthase C-terminal domain-containing protein [Pseudomonadota bacterium]MBU4286786.1 asparagine synthase C-terminal domain-containing protein [Pseudomonadota bacterium]MBU4413642.1 asparagine synthase C-terminal domain-containing protein [Pseudomonadota bacterium]MCG2758614.1 asparagine synthase C-terminal domain-containing protein [Desulfobacteraceae bacterium]
MIICVNCNGNITTEESPVYQSRNVFVFSKEDYEKFILADESILFLWGEVYAICMPNGTYISIDLKTHERDIVNFFSNYSIDQAIDKIEGNFVGLLIRNGEIAIFGDEFNRKELFYRKINDGIIASTNLKAVIKTIDTIRYSQNVLVNLLTIYGYYAPKKHTIYRDVYRLGVGERLHFSLGSLTVEKKPFEPLKTGSFGIKEHNEYVEIMRSAVEIRASSHCNWIFMSSGFDSSSILALLVEKYGPEKVRCVVGRMKYSERAGVINQFELDRAHKIAEYFGVRIDQVDFDFTGQKSVESWKQTIPLLRDQHLYAYSAYNFYHLAKYVADNGNSDDAVFVGAVSDGVHNLGFAQFATILEHPDIGFREYSDKMASYLFGPSFFKRILEGDIENDFVYQIMKSRSDGAEFYNIKKMDEYEKKIKFLESFFHRNRRIPFLKLKNISLVTQGGAESFENEMANIYLKEVAEKLIPETVYSCILYLYNSYFWQGSTERSTNAGALDVMGKTITSPYWDGRLHRFLSKMPEDWGRGLELRPTKYPLKWMLQNAVDYPLHLQTGPHSYLYDVNPQFSHTSEFLFGSALKFYLQEILKNRPYEEILESSYFNLEYINSIVDEYVAGREFSGAKMNDLLAIANLCLIGWY